MCWLIIENKFSNIAQNIVWSSVMSEVNAINTQSRSLYIKNPTVGLLKGPEIYLPAYGIGASVSCDH